MKDLLDKSIASIGMDWLFVHLGWSEALLPRQLEVVLASQAILIYISIRANYNYQK